MRTDIFVAPKRYVYTSLKDDLVLRPLFWNAAVEERISSEYKHMLACICYAVLKFSENHRHYTT